MAKSKKCAQSPVHVYMMIPVRVVVYEREEGGQLTYPIAVSRRVGKKGGKWVYSKYLHENDLPDAIRLLQHARDDLKIQKGINEVGD